MRDPDAPLKTIDSKMCREISDKKLVNFLNSDAIVKIKEKIVDFKIVDNVLFPEVIQPVSYPYEWVSLQLHDAGILTLDVMESILSTGYELKDASAWNVIYKGGVPLFCDHGSFSRIESYEWWAFGQFVRNFITPLLIEKKSGMQVSEVFSLYRDGVSLEDMKKFGLGFLNSGVSFSLLYLFRGKNETSINVNKANTEVDLEKAIQQRRYLIKYLRYLLGKLKPNINKSVWINYTSNRSHYSEDAMLEKRKVVTNYISLCSDGAYAIDIGGNDGEFSKILSKKYSKVACLDIDNGALSNLYGDKDKDYYTFLVERLASPSLILFLAIVHHIHITSSVPIGEIIRALSILKPNSVIFEAVYYNDPMAKGLASKTNRDIKYLTPAYYVEELSKFFTIIDRGLEKTSSREMFLLKLKK